MLDPDWFETDALANGVTRIREAGLGPLHAANIWLVRGRDRSLLIDAGVGVAPLRPLVERLADRPVICLLTHAHYDHMGGAWEFADRRAHPLEAATLAEPTPERTHWRGWLTDASFSRLPSPGFRMSGYALRPAPPTSLVDEGTRIDLGDRLLELLHVPGHAPGLLAVHDPAHGLLFTSDALYRGRMFFDLPGSSLAAAERSIRRLASLARQVVHPGHGGSFTGADAEEIAASALAQIDRIRTRA